MTDWRKALQEWIANYDHAAEHEKMLAGLDEWERDYLRRRAMGDTSGSVRPEVMQSFLGELQGICEDLGITTTVHGDVAVNGDVLTEIRPEDSDA